MFTVENNLHIGFRLRNVHNLAKRKLDEFTGRVDERRTSAIQHWIIGHLAHHPDEEVFQRDIEAQFNIRRSTATGILQLMEQNGLIHREPVDYDARLKRIVLTEKALAEEARCREKIDRFELLMTKDIDQQELGTFVAVLDKIIRNLEEITPC